MTHRRELGMAVSQSAVAQRHFAYQVGNKLQEMGRSPGFTSRYVYYTKLYQEGKVEFLPTWLYEIAKYCAPKNIEETCYSFASFVEKEYEFMNDDFEFTLAGDRHKSLLGAGCSVDKVRYATNWPLVGTPAIVVDGYVKTRKDGVRGCVRFLITRDSAKVIDEIDDVQCMGTVVMVASGVMYHLNNVGIDIKGFKNVAVAMKTSETDMLCMEGREYHVYYAPKTVDNKVIDVFQEELKQPISLGCLENDHNVVEVFSSNSDERAIIAKQGTTVEILNLPDINLEKRKDNEKESLFLFKQKHYRSRFCEFLKELHIKHPVFSIIEPIVITNVLTDDDFLTVDVQQMPHLSYKINKKDCEDKNTDNYCLYMIVLLVKENYRGKKCPEERFYIEFCDLLGVVTKKGKNPLMNVREAIIEMYGCGNSDAVGTIYRPERYCDVKHDLQEYYYASKIVGQSKLLLGFNGLLYLVSENYEYEVIGTTTRSFLCDIVLTGKWIWVQDCLFYLGEDTFSFSSRSYYTGYVRLEAARRRLACVEVVVEDVQMSLRGYKVSVYGFKEFDSNAGWCVDRGDVLFMSPEPYVRGFSHRSYNCSHRYSVKAKAGVMYHASSYDTYVPDFFLFVQDQYGRDVFLTSFALSPEERDSTGQVIPGTVTKITASINWGGDIIQHHDRFIENAVYECEYDADNDEWNVIREVSESRYDSAFHVYWIEMVGQAMRDSSCVSDDDSQCFRKSLKYSSDRETCFSGTEDDCYSDSGGD